MNIDRKNAPESLRELARNLCGCAENVQGGCPMPSVPCLQRALVHQQKTADGHA